MEEPDRPAAPPRHRPARPGITGRRCQRTPPKSGTVDPGSYAGDLPFVRITPEGFEDADCEESDKSHTFVQMKEVDAGQGTIAAAGVAETLAHAEASARGSTIVLITDGSLGSRLAFTGWDTLLSQQGTDDVKGVVSALVNRDYDEAEARDIVRRTRLVQLALHKRGCRSRRVARRVGPGVGVEVSRRWKFSHHPSGRPRRVSRYLRAP